MKFPLPERPFRPLQLSAEAKQSLITLADHHLESMLSEYEMLRFEQNSRVDPSKWKHVRKKYNIDVYQLRTQVKQQYLHKSEEEEEENLLQLQNAQLAPDSAALLWYGTMDGNLNDVMYGVVCPTADIMRLKSTYVPDNIADCMVLATIIEATAADPFRGLLLKWCVTPGPPIVRPVIRARDSAYLESTGITTSGNGEPIGYHFFHTLTIPGIRQLHEYKFVRASMSLFHLFRQKEDGIVEVYVRSMVDLLGDIPPSVTVLTVGEAVASLTQTPMFAEMKKLTWLVKTRKVWTTNANPRICCGCQKFMKNRQIDYKNSCYVCMRRVCSKCRNVKKMSFLAPGTREVVQQSILFCAACIQSALHTDGMIVAADEISRENLQNSEMFELESITDSSSRASVTSFTNMRWMRSLSRASVE